MFVSLLQDVGHDLEPVALPPGGAGGSGGPPPPPEPEEPLPKRVMRRRPGFHNLSWEVENGKIVFDDERDNIDAHCNIESHSCKGNPCRLVRKRLPHASGRQDAQGRPVGLELLWLELGPTKATREDHVNMLKPRLRTMEDVIALSRPKRLAARERGKAKPELKEVFDLERPPWTGEGPEPEGIP